MNKIQLLEIYNSNKSLNSKFTIIGKAIKNETLNWLEFPQDLPKNEQVYLFINSLSDAPRCKCGKNTKFIGFSRGYRTYCGVSCAKRDSSIETKQKIKQSFQLKYGVDNPFLLESSKIKQKESSKLKIGKSLSKDHLQAIKSGVQKKYGVDSVFDSVSIRGKINSTMIDRYGGYYISSKKFIDKKRENWINRKLSLLESVHRTKLLETFIGTKQKYKALCLDCNTEYSLSIMNGQTSRCPKCYFLPANRSLKEQELSKFIEGLGFTVLTNVKNKDLIYPYSLDIWIPELKTAIEFNGNYWHREELIGKDYHLEKLQRCKDKGINLIQIFEYEFDNKRDQVYSRIESILGINKIKIGARECQLVEITLNEERGFLEQNHLQGYVASSYRIGLKHNQELVMVMTFGKPRFNKKYNNELLRISSVSKKTIVGGASKLMSHALKSGINNIITYRDRRWGESDFYKNLGFKLIHLSDPSYVYVKNGIVISRYKARKKDLALLLGDKFDLDLTETENMEKSRFNKLWDCGQEVYQM